MSYHAIFIFMNKVFCFCCRIYNFFHLNILNPRYFKHFVGIEIDYSQRFFLFDYQEKIFNNQLTVTFFFFEEYFY